MKDLVSIIMLSHNKAKYLAASIKSIMAQTYQNWELLLVDDASNDGSIGLLMELKGNDKRFRISQCVYKKGETANRNSALREAKGRWIAFLDAGDIWEPTKLEKQVRFMESNNYAFSYTTYRCIDVNMRDLGVVVAGPEQINYHEMLKCCWMGYQTVMYDSTKIGLLQVSCMATVNDYALWLQAAQKADCHLLPECLATQVSGKGLCLRLLSSPKWLWRYEAYRKIEGLNTLSAAYMTVRNIAYAAWKWWKFAC